MADSVEPSDLEARIGDPEEWALRSALDAAVHEAEEHAAAQASLLAEVERLRGALEHAQGFIDSVQQWEGHPDDQEEAAQEVAEALRARSCLSGGSDR